MRIACLLNFKTVREFDPCPQTGVNKTYIGRTKLGKTPNSKCTDGVL